jgi:hypothetical protein
VPRRATVDYPRKPRCDEIQGDRAICEATFARCLDVPAFVVYAPVRAESDGRDPWRHSRILVSFPTPFGGGQDPPCAYCDGPVAGIATGIAFHVGCGRMVVVPRGEAAILAWALNSDRAGNLHHNASRVAEQIQAAIWDPAELAHVRLSAGDLLALHAIFDSDEGVLSAQLAAQVSLQVLRRIVAIQLG